MKKAKKADDLLKDLAYKRGNFWKDAPEKETKDAMAFADNYKQFLNAAKTEREAVVAAVDILKKHGFSEIGKKAGAKKVYGVSKGKNVFAAIIGKKPIAEGLNIVASHLDSPRVDLKQNPLYEDGTTQLAIMRTHYYGGIKKYQWMSTPLALHGTVIKKDGKAVNICIGEDESDPIFIMPDLLPHLARKVQTGKTLAEAIEAGNMNLIFSSIPYIEEAEKDVKDAVKLNALLLLHEKYGITEGDFLSAELQLVPAGKARDAGLDRSLIAAYGQDDRICAYTSLEALLNIEEPEHTALVFLADKEEIGSEGNTGAKSIFMTDFIADLLKHHKESYDSYSLRKTLINSKILSADVNAGINPNFPSVHEPANAVILGGGVALTKFTGSGGKGGSNDANTEFMAKIIDIFNQNGIIWQVGSLGKVDEGGGGTIAKFLAECGAEVIDCGTALLGMHSLYELCSKADLFSTYKAYQAFLQKA